MYWRENFRSFFLQRLKENCLPQRVETHPTNSSCSDLTQRADSWTEDTVIRGAQQGGWLSCNVVDETQPSQPETTEMSGHPEKHHPKQIADPENSQAGSGDRPSKLDGPALSLVPLNVKNIKTNLSLVYHLASKYKIILLHEHWLYGFETSLLQQVFYNSNFLIKYIDDKDPLSPVKPPRGYAGTSVLWSSGLNHCISPIPDGSDRVMAVELTTREEKVCLECVYMPALGPTDSGINFASTLDELHEIITKYSTTHSIILGGDFNATLHQSKGPIKRDKLLEAFLNERHLFHARVLTVRPSYRLLQARRDRC